MPKIVSTDQMRAIEQAADQRGHAYAAMMELAGRAVAVRAQERLAGLDQPRVVVLVGPGNNGGDGLVVARLLKGHLEDGAVSAFMLKPRDPAADPVFAAAQEAGVFLVDAADDQGKGYRVLKQLVASADLIIDALFGTSVRLPLKDDVAAVLRAVHQTLNARRAERPRPPYTTPTDPSSDLAGEWTEPVILAIDCPSGLDCDTGQLDSNALIADETVTFAAAKPGLFHFPAADAVGTLHIGDIGLPAPLPELDDVPLLLVDAGEVASRLPLRARSGHKGTYGKTLIAAGSLNYMGAPFLAASAAYRVGAGLVTVAAPQIIVPTLAGMLPEATWLLLPHDMGVLNAAAVKVLRESLAGYSALLIGPGLTAEDSAADFLTTLLAPAVNSHALRTLGFATLQPDSDAAESAPALPPLVLDADALNILARTDNWAEIVPPNTILTPHPAEFGRLAGLETSAVQADRLPLAQTKAAEWNCVVVLKGAFTVIAAPDGRAALLPFATSALATAGTGDVLAGSIAGLLGQGLDPFDAALAGGWIHGMAGTRAAWMLDTEASVTAGDVLDLLPTAYALAEQHRPQ